MKNIINFKSILPYSICLAGTMIFATSCSENKTMDSKEVAEKENIDKLAANEETIVVIDNDNGTKFLMEVAELQLEEISLGKLAQQKGTSAHVKELGQMMETDHTKSLTELTALAQSKSVSIPTSVTDDSKDAYEKLDGKTGNDFDKAYSDMMVKHHEDAIKLFEKASTDSEDAEIKTWASNKLPGLKTHLDHAKACKEKCDKMTT
ncbi:MAG TPA: DUF4142 domain-containing protein [Algoriphagus sp.]|nr:DUF4142 domain-containing protein [Algoriphagus sp.]